MNKMNKKALSNTLVAIIAAVLAGAVIMGVVFPALANASESRAESLCKTSVAVRAGTTVKLDLKLGTVELQTSPLLCKTLTPEIKEDREKVSREIANKMARCWELFGEGTYVNSVFETLSIFGGGKGCFTCYVLAVEETKDFKEGRDAISPNEFMDFLRTANYPAGSERTFLNYFQTAGGPGNVISLLPEKGLQPNRAYAVSYKVGRSSCGLWCSLLAGPIFGALTGTGGALIFVWTEPADTPPGTETQTLLARLAASQQILSPLPGSTGTGIVGYTGYNFVVNDILNQASIDTIILSDITNPQINAQVRQACNFVEDIEGKKIR